jgi:large subunit ribosomal protein L25
MERAIIQATKRQELGTRATHRLRREGLVPAVLYGHKIDPVHLAVPRSDLERLVGAGARMVDVEIGGTVETALVKDIQHDSLGDEILHIDFARVALDEKVSVTVPVELHGLAKGVGTGGVLDHALQDFHVRCLPGDIPEKIRVEIASLDIGGIIYVRDIVPPEGVELLNDPDAPVVAVHAPVAAEVKPVTEELPSEPEVISGRREKEEEAGEEGEQG